MPDEKDRQIAELKKQLATATAEQSTGWAGLFSLIGSVVNLVPKWLIPAAGLVFVAWLGFDLYINAQMKLIEKDRAAADAARAKVEADRAPQIVQSEIDQKKADAQKAAADAVIQTNNAKLNQQTTDFDLSPAFDPDALKKRFSKRY
jgi:hypothetical protein